jgi:hypothetical protein
MLTWEEDVEAAALRAQGWSIADTEGSGTLGVQPPHR